MVGYGKERWMDGRLGASNQGAGGASASHCSGCRNRRALGLYYEVSGLLANADCTGWDSIQSGRPNWLRPPLARLRRTIVHGEKDYVIMDAVMVLAAQVGVVIGEGGAMLQPGANVNNIQAPMAANDPVALWKRQIWERVLEWRKVCQIAAGTVDISTRALILFDPTD